MQKISYIGDGSTTDFFFNFPFYTNTDIVVLKNNQTAIDYTIVGTSAGQNADIPYVGGKIVFNTAPFPTDSITIYRHLPLNRVVDYQPTEKINPINLNQDMNYMMEILKDMEDKIGTFAEQYNDIVNKESTDNLLSKINHINQLIDNDEFINKYISNCTTKIPQDIKLELDNEYLVVKAGSKIYKPNGSGVFDTYIAQNDIRWTTNSTGTYMVFWAGSAIDIVSINNLYSGSTAPTGIAQYSVWYDTTNNVIKKTNDSGSTWQGIYTFPLCIINSVSGSGVVSIEQTFNGFGYIGSTVFVLPGVKGFIPNGRNTDGTLKSTSLNVSNVITKTFTGTANTILAVKTNVIIEGNGIWYDSTNNYNYYSSSSTSPEIALPFATATLTSGKISNFYTKKILTTVNKEDVVNLTMPSKKYIDLTLGTSGTNYIAPADGYFTINKGGSDGEWIYLLDTSTGLSISSLYPASLNARLFIPVAKGRSIQIQYTASGTTNHFRFIYANGAQ